MKKKISRFFICIFFICAAIFLFKIFYPLNYNVPSFKANPTTKYWNLPTGSRIGYTFIKAINNKKPYPVIYLHGGPGGHVSDRDIKILASLSRDGYDVYLYDQIGSGQSGRLSNISDYTVERHIEDLQEIMHRTGAQKVILIGQSWGAILAVLFAVGHPDEIEKLIFTSPGPIYPFHQKLASIQPPDSIHLTEPFFTNAEGNEVANNLRTKAMKLFATAFGKKLATEKEADEFATYLNYEVNRSTVCDTSKILPEESGDGFYAGVMTYHSLTKVEDRRRQIETLTIPVLVLKGACDNQKWGFTNEYLQLFQNHRLVIIPNAGHFISVEQPELYIKAIRQFLN